MGYLWHALMTEVWAVLFVLGIIFGGIMWVCMALWDTAKRIFRRLDGEIDRSQDEPRPL